mgnify:CR=1 FL=1
MTSLWITKDELHIERIYITQGKCILYVLQELIVYITTDNKIKNWDNKGDKVFKKKMFSAALACGLCVALSMPAYGAEVRGDITSDIVCDGQDWVYVENGQVNNSYTGVRQNDNGWWRVEAGKVNFGYNGLAENEYGWWVIKDGNVDFDCNGLIEDEKAGFT